MDTAYQLLIVEDDTHISSILQEYFGPQGYQVHVAAWGEAAIAHCQENPPDLILLDVRLPGMDGYEVYARLKQHARTRDTPVIFLTERRGRDDKLTGLQQGAIDYIAKPFDLEELSLRVRNALHSRPSVGPGEWAALYLRLQNLGSLDRKHGSPTGEQMLRVVVDVINEVVAELGGDKDFVGHLREGDLMLVTSPERVESLREEITARLQKVLRWLAVPWQKDVQGGESEESLLAVQIGVLTSADLPPDADPDLSNRLDRGEVPLETLPLDL